MPRYLLETPPTSDADRDRILRLAARRFPEIALEHGFAIDDDTDRHDLWVCRAASDTHIRRWARAGALELRTVRRISDDAVISTARGGRS